MDGLVWRTIGMDRNKSKVRTWRPNNDWYHCVWGGNKSERRGPFRTTFGIFGVSPFFWQNPMAASSGVHVQAGVCSYILLVFFSLFLPRISFSLFHLHLIKHEKKSTVRRSSLCIRLLCPPRHIVFHESIGYTNLGEDIVNRDGDETVRGREKQKLFFYKLNQYISGPDWNRFSYHDEGHFLFFLSFVRCRSFSLTWSHILNIKGTQVSNTTWILVASFIYKKWGRFM